MTTEMPVEVRRENRSPRLFRGFMQTDRLPPFVVVIRNISQHGLCALSRGLPPVMGEAGEMRLPCNSLTRGTVKWVDGQMFGLAFDEPLNLQSFFHTLHWQRRIDQSQTSWAVKPMHRVADNRPVPDRLRRL